MKLLNLVLITMVIIGCNSVDSKSYELPLDKVPHTQDMVWVSNSCMFYAPNAMKKVPVTPNKSSRVYCVIS